MNTSFETIDDFGERHLNLQANHELAYEQQINSAETVREVREAAIAVVESYEQRGIDGTIFQELINRILTQLLEVIQSSRDNYMKEFLLIGKIINSARMPKENLVSPPPR